MLMRVNGSTPVSSLHSKIFAAPESSYSSVACGFPAADACTLPRISSAERTEATRFSTRTYPVFPAAFSPKRTVSRGLNLISWPVARAFTPATLKRRVRRSSSVFSAAVAPAARTATFGGAAWLSPFSARSMSYAASTLASTSARRAAITSVTIARTQWSCSFAQSMRSWRPVRAVGVCGSGMDD